MVDYLEGRDILTGFYCMIFLKKIISALAKKQ